MKIRQVLFSFNGRIRRRTYWCTLILPLVGIGLIIGGILSAQSMIEIARGQKACKEIVSNGAHSGAACKDAYVTLNAYRKAGSTENAVTFCHQNQLGMNATCEEIAEVMPLLGVIIPASKNIKNDGVPVLGGSLTIILIAAPFIILFCWITIAVTAKRLHDLGLSGWWQLLPAGIDLLSEASERTAIGFLLAIISGVANLAFFIYCGFWPGKPEDNKYGPAPKRKKQ